MQPRPIRNDEDHAAALRRIDHLWESPEGSPEADELEVLSMLVGAYEETRWPLDAPDPVDVLHFVMQQRGMSAADLVRYLGPRGQVNDILNRRKGLSLKMIQRLHQDLGIPADLLIKPIRLQAESA